jgi:arginyl-tRNA synthetase
MGARISALLRKAAEPGGAASPSGNTEPVQPGLLTGDPEWEVLKALAAYPGTVAAAAEGLDPSFLAASLYELSRAFSRFYHDCPILGAAEPGLAAARLRLCRGVLAVLRDALDLICVPFLEAM